MRVQLYDPMIQFWAEYWKDKKRLPKEVDPLLIKAMIAVESSFCANIVSGEDCKETTTESGTSQPETQSKALGLMQLRTETLDYLGRGSNPEVTRYLINLADNDAFTPIANIAAGIRWLGHKIEKSPLGDSNNIADRIFGGVQYYHGWDFERNDIYANKVYKIYNETVEFHGYVFSS